MARSSYCCTSWRAPLLKVYFSFHYERDVWRAAIVRNSQRFRKESTVVDRFLDAVDWEQVRRTSDTVIRRWINEQLQNTSVTVVLIGAETSARYWVRYEIEQSIKLGKGLLGVRIHAIKDSSGSSDLEGLNPLASCYQVYDWFPDNGYANLGKWIEDAARAAGR